MAGGWVGGNLYLNRGGDVANEENLIPMNKRTKKEQREISKKGGKSSVSARRRKKSMRECAEIVLSAPVSDKKLKELKNLNINADESDYTMRLAIMAAIALKAADGDVPAYKEMMELDETSTDTRSEKEFEIPALMIAPPFLNVYRDIRSENHSEYVLYGGRGSTKSSFVSMIILELLKRDENIHALVCRKVKDTLRDSVYAQMVWAIGELGLEHEFTCKVSPMEIIYQPTGQKIFFRGADDPGKLKSQKPPFGYIGILWFEELDQFSGDNEIRNIEQSVIRGGDRSFVFKTFNPPQTAANWANKYIKLPKEKRYDHHSTYLDVPSEWLGSKFIEEAEFLKEVNPKAYEHEYLGMANGTGGQVFDNVTMREISDKELKSFDRIYRGIDWGWYPDPFRYHAMHYQANERRLYLFDEISGNKLPNLKISDLLKQHGVTGEHKITADSGGEGPKSIADLRSAGFYMRPAIKGPGSVEYSMKWLSSLNEIIIDPKRCPEAAEEFLNYEYERDKDGEVISGYPDKDNHSIDAVRYALEEVWRRRGK